MLNRLVSSDALDYPVTHERTSELFDISKDSKQESKSRSTPIKRAALSLTVLSHAHGQYGSTTHSKILVILDSTFGHH